MGPRDLPTRFAATVLANRRAVILITLILTIGFGAGLTGIEGDLSIATFGVESPEAETQAYVDDRFEIEDQRVTILLVKGENVLTKDSIHETMTLQAAIRTDDRIAPTLRAENPTVGLGNAIATYAEPRLWLGGTPTIADQLTVLEGLDEERFATARDGAIAGDGGAPDAGIDGSALVPTDIEPEASTADARLIVVFHGSTLDGPAELEAQRAMESLAEEIVPTADIRIVGEAIVQERSATATGENFRIVGPISVLLVAGILWAAYRDPIDMGITMVGIGMTLVWTGGFVGWLGLPVTQLLVAIPCLLVGLAIDYGLHVEMRYREASTVHIDHSDAMRAGLAGVLAAIGITTITTALGFSTGIASPIGILQDFGLVAAAGIVFAFVIFGAVIPAITLELDWIRSRQSPSHTVGRGRIGSTLATIAGRSLDAPVVVVAVAVLLAVGGVVGGVAIDTESDRNDFLPDDRPGWMEHLPGDLTPANPQLRSTAIELEERFGGPVRDDVHIVVTGNVTHPETLTLLDRAETAAWNSSVVINDVDTVTGPNQALRSTRQLNRSLGEAIDEADTIGDGIPDRNLAAIYDGAFRTAGSDIDRVIYRTPDGEYESIRLTISVDPRADSATVAEEMRLVAATIDAHPELTAVPTGDPILSEIDRQAVLSTVITSFVLALLIITFLVAVIFRLRHDSWWLGPVTVLPVVMALAWLLGAMALLDLPFNAETALITGIAIGIGVDYSIHITERFRQVLGPENDVQSAIRISVRETGGTVAISAVTTAIGFGVLGLMFIPSLRRFGLITATVVLLAAVASLVVLPALLAIAGRNGGSQNG